MLCPTCHGHHVVSTRLGDQPCPECGGMGEVHCCDGLQEQSEFDGIPACQRRGAFIEPLTISSPN